MSSYIMNQISMFSENRPGRLALFAKAMMEEKINIYAFSIAEADGFGIIRAVVSDPEKAKRKLAGMGFTVSFTEVIAVQMKDEPGGLYDVAHMLAEAGINIEYSYAYSREKKAVLVLRVDRSKEAVETILEKGGRLLNHLDL